MSEPLIHSFQRFDDAEAARAALLSAGLDASALELRVIADEAGPVEGNFLVGNGRDARDDTVETGLRGGPDAPPYADNFAAAVTRGVYLLVVQPGDRDEREKAASVLQRSGGVDAAAAGDSALRATS